RWAARCAQRRQPPQRGRQHRAVARAPARRRRAQPDRPIGLGREDHRMTSSATEPAERGFATEPTRRGFATTQVHTGFTSGLPVTSAVPAIHQTAAYEFSSLQEAADLFALRKPGIIYSRNA